MGRSPTGDSDDLPLQRLIGNFLDGLAGGDRGRFGTALAVDVIRVLSQCEAALPPVRAGRVRRMAPAERA